MSARLIAAAKAAIARMERDTIQIEEDWGWGRSLEILESSGAIPELVELRMAIAEAEKPKHPKICRWCFYFNDTASKCLNMDVDEVLTHAGSSCDKWKDVT